MGRRKLCVVSGGRAEYGLLYWLLREILSDNDLELQLIVTGMHLSQEFGATYQKIEADGFVINTKVEMLLSSDSAVGIAKSMGLGLIGFADAFATLLPDIVIVLGDRFEIFAATQAAMVARLPVAHISGGEVTEGGIDDCIRHSISKMANYHFVSSETYRRRVIQLGEEPSRVMNFGDPGLENIFRLPMISREELSENLGFDLSSPYFLVTYHPETLTGASHTDAVNELFFALDQFPEYRVIITKANADEGGRVINEMIDRYGAERKDRVYVSMSLGQQRYLGAMRYCEAIIGNSSSGIVEAPALLRPTVNVGSRQTGRLMANSIICCGHSQDAILVAIRKAISNDFKSCLANTKFHYDQGRTSILIKDYLKNVKLTGVIKQFRDVIFSEDHLLA